MKAQNPKRNSTSLWFYVKGKRDGIMVSWSGAKLVLVLRTWHRRMGAASMGFTDGPWETQIWGRGRPRIGRKAAKTSCGIPNRIKRKTLFSIWSVRVFSTGGSGCSGNLAIQRERCSAEQRLRWSERGTQSLTLRRWRTIGTRELWLPGWHSLSDSHLLWSWLSVPSHTVKDIGYYVCLVVLVCLVWFLPRKRKTPRGSDDNLTC